MVSAARPVFMQPHNPALVGNAFALHSAPPLQPCGCQSHPPHPPHPAPVQPRRRSLTHPAHHANRSGARAAHLQSWRRLPSFRPLVHSTLLRRTAPTCRPHTLSADRAGGLPRDVFERVDWSLCSHTIHTDTFHTVPSLSLPQPSSHPSYAADAGLNGAQPARPVHKSHHRSHETITAVVCGLGEHTQAPISPLSPSSFESHSEHSAFLLFAAANP